jgi:hypothetical protein
MPLRIIRLGLAACLEANGRTRHAVNQSILGIHQKAYATLRSGGQRGFDPLGRERDLADPRARGIKDRVAERGRDQGD